jgi:hypothetical protein
MHVGYDGIKLKNSGFTTRKPPMKENNLEENPSLHSPPQHIPVGAGEVLWRPRVLDDPWRFLLTAVVKFS